MAKKLTIKETREWMNRYHDLWIEDHNRLVEAGIEHPHKQEGK